MNKFTLLLTLVVLFSPSMAEANSDTIISCRDTIVCYAQSAFQISLCTPSGGHYFGPGVKDTAENTYVPAWAGIGTHFMTYKTDTSSCLFRVTVIDLVTASPIAGNRKLCGGGSDQTYQFSSDTTATIYYWRIPQWGNFMDSTSLPINTIHFDGSFHGGTLQASMLNQCGEGPRSSVQIQVLPKPLPIIKNISDTLSEKDDICKNQHLAYYANGDFDSCKWTVQGGALIGRDTSRLITVKWGTTSETGTITVTAHKNGCPGSSFRDVILGDGIAPDPSTIWLFGYNMLVCSDSTASSYCWFQDNNVYTGFVSASGRYILPEPLNKQSYYFVRTGSNSSCSSCYNDSEPYNFSKTGLDNLVKSLFFAPNPAQDKIELKSTSNIELSGRILMFNRLGALVKEKHITSGDAQIDISLLPAGIYFTEYLSRTGYKLTSKIIKL